MDSKLPAPLLALLPYLKGVAALIAGVGVSVAAVVALPHAVTVAIAIAGIVAVVSVPNLTPVKPGNPAVAVAGEGADPVNPAFATKVQVQPLALPDVARVVHDTDSAPPLLPPAPAPNVVSPPDSPAPPTPQP